MCPELISLQTLWTSNKSWSKPINNTNVRTRYGQVRMRSRNSWSGMFMTNGILPPSEDYCEYKRDILSIMWQKHMYSATSNRDTPTCWPLVIIFPAWLNIRWGRVRAWGQIGDWFHSGEFRTLISIHDITCGSHNSSLFTDD